MNAFELFDNAVGIMGCDSDIVDIDGNVLVDPFTGAHPNVGVGFARYKTHIRSVSANLSCQRSPLLRKPYKALLMMSM
jgi:hypothetical protein